MLQMIRLTGKRLNRELALGAEHARYHKDGYWYDQLHKFPGILFDQNGYVSFADLETYQRCPQLRHPDCERLDGRPGTWDIERPKWNCEYPRLRARWQNFSIEGPLRRSNQPCA